jgi:hypothetical protein
MDLHELGPLGGRSPRRRHRRRLDRFTYVGFARTRRRAATAAFTGAGMGNLPHLASAGQAPFVALLTGLRNTSQSSAACQDPHGHSWIRKTVPHSNLTASSSDSKIRRLFCHNLCTNVSHPPVTEVPLTNYSLTRRSVGCHGAPNNAVVSCWRAS